MLSSIEEKKKELRDRYKRSFLTKKDLARELGGISVETVDRLRKDGLISSRKVRGTVMVSIEETARYIVQG